MPQVLSEPVTSDLTLSSVTLRARGPAGLSHPRQEPCLARPLLCCEGSSSQGPRGGGGAPGQLPLHCGRGSGVSPARCFPSSPSNSAVFSILASGRAKGSHGLGLHTGSVPRRALCNTSPVAEAHVPNIPLSGRRETHPPPQCACGRCLWLMLL